MLSAQENKAITGLSLQQCVQTSVEKNINIVQARQDKQKSEYKDEEDFAYEIVEQCYALPEFAKTYFDYEKFTRVLFIGDYWYEDGYVFRCS